MRFMRSDASTRSYLARLKMLSSRTSAHEDVTDFPNMTYSQSGSALPCSAPEVLSLNDSGSKKVYFSVGFNFI